MGFSGVGDPTTPSPHYPLATASGLGERETLKGVYGKQPFGTRSRWTCIPRFVPIPPGRHGSYFWNTGSAPSNPAKTQISPFGIRTCTPSPAAELRNLKCTMTIYHGEVVYRQNRHRPVKRCSKLKECSTALVMRSGKPSCAFSLRRVTDASTLPRWFRRTTPLCFLPMRG